MDVPLLDYVTQKQESILCNICGLTFTNNNTFKCHQVASNMEQYDYQCNHCNKTFNRLDNIQRHMKTVHSTTIGPGIKHSYPK